MLGCQCARAGGATWGIPCSRAASPRRKTKFEWEDGSAAPPLVPSNEAALESASAAYSHWAFDEPNGPPAEFCAAATHWGVNRAYHYFSGSTQLDFKEQQNLIKALDRRDLRGWADFNCDVVTHFGLLPLCSGFACWMRPGGAPLPLPVCPLLRPALSRLRCRVCRRRARPRRPPFRVPAAAARCPARGGRQLGYSRFRPAAGSLMLRHRRPLIPTHFVICESTSKQAQRLRNAPTTLAACPAGIRCPYWYARC
jgi:hypothetical protein